MKFMNLLKELRVNEEGILPSFNKDIFNYYLTINQNINNIEIEAIPENPNSQIEIIGNTNLKYGENNIVIKLILNNEETIYSIKVVKTQDLELANCNLETLAIENGLVEPAFDANITDYKINISNDTTQLNILAIPQNENAKIEIYGNEKLEVGDNLIEIIVTAQDKTTKKKYSITAYRKTQQETNEYIKVQKENEERLQELITQTNADYGYDAEKTSYIITRYNSNSEIIETGILLSILFVILILLALLKSRKQ